MIKRIIPRSSEALPVIGLGTFITRIANALDAEHLQKVKGVRLLRSDAAWILEVDGDGDLTMEQLAATARADMFIETFGRALIVRLTGVHS